MGMPKENKGRLLFAPTAEPTGIPFVIAGFKAAKSTTIVRELIQNSLDAVVEKNSTSSAQGNQKADIKFKVEEVLSKNIPCWDTYLEKIKLMKKQPGVEHNNDAIEHIEAIEETAKQMKQHVLFVTDNGIGLTESTMTSLLREGSSQKQKGSSGSYGLGHYTAFAASKLKYVLYASKNSEDDVTCSGCVQGLSFIENSEFHSHTGKLYHEDQIQGNLFKATQKNKYLEDNLPSLLQECLAPISNTGTTVAILGFNWFKKKDSFGNLVDSIFTVLATQFTIAFLEDKLSVTISLGSKKKVLDRESLLRFLESKQADSGTKLSIEKKTELTCAQDFVTTYTSCKQNNHLSHIYRLSAPFNDCSIMQLNEFPQQIVSVWRNGMLIRVNHREFNDSYFQGRKNFSAMIILDGSQPGQTLAHDTVRKAEDPEHKNFALSNIAKPGQQKLYRDFIAVARKNMLNTAIKFSHKQMELDAIRYTTSVPVQENYKLTSEPGDSPPTPRPSGVITPDNGSLNDPIKPKNKVKSLRYKISGNWVGNSWQIILSPLVSCNYAALSLDLSRGQDATCDSENSLNIGTKIKSATLLEGKTNLRCDINTIFLKEIKKDQDYTIEIKFYGDNNNLSDLKERALYPKLHSVEQDSTGKVTI